MAMTVQVDIVSIEKSIFSGLAEFIAAPAESGEVGIYPGHAPMIARLRSGAVRLKLPGRSGEEVVYISSGMLEVQPRRVTVLSDLAILEEEMDEDKLMDENRKVSQTMKNRVTAQEYARMEAVLATAFRDLHGFLQLMHRRKGL